ncbi:MAG: VWA domain-containing protein [Chloroflexota bacterium]|nr:VWA domain-containing protein [Chloroflexota bacterium]
MRSTAKTSEYDYLTHLSRFARALRSLGLLVGPSEVSDALNLLYRINSASKLLLSRSSLYWTLRSLFVSRKSEIHLFDSAFERFWSFDFIPVKEDINKESDLFRGGKDFRRRRSDSVIPEHDSSSGNLLFHPEKMGADDRESREYLEISHLAENEIIEIPRIASRLIKSLSDRPGRRYHRGGRHGSVDIRSIFRTNLGHGGELLKIPRKEKLPRVPKLIMLLDVSGSMDKHTKNLLRLAFEVCRQTTKVRVFVFSTILTEVTRDLRAPTVGEAVKKISGRVSHWSGGTKIGICLYEFQRVYSTDLDRDTTVMLMSDGWDTGEPQEVVTGIRKLSRVVKKIIWLNPLLGTDRYEQDTRTLKAVESYVDIFASSRNIESLKKLPELVS